MKKRNLHLITIGWLQQYTYVYLTRNVCITKYARQNKLSNGIMVMTPK